MKLTDYKGADDPDKRLRLGAPEAFKDPPPTTRPTGPARKLVGEYSAPTPSGCWQEPRTKAAKGRPKATERPRLKLQQKLAK